MAAARIAPSPVERECDIFARRLAVHLAKREYAAARQILELAVARIDQVWDSIGKPPVYVSDLELPAEVYEALVNHSIVTIDELLRWRGEDLVAYHVLGPQRTAIVEKRLKHHGLRLRRDDAKQTA